MSIKKEYQGILESKDFDQNDLEFFSFRESLKARWKELKHSYALLSKSPLFFLGLFIIIVLVALAVIAPYLAPYKCYTQSNCQTETDPITNTVYKLLPPMSKDTRITSIYWTPLIAQKGSFPSLAGAGNLSIAAVPGFNDTPSNQLLVGTSNGQLLLFKESFPSSGGNVTLTQVSNSTYPLPAVPKGLTVVMPAIGDVNNDSLNDIVVGGNTGMVYLSLNEGTSTHPVWSPWQTLKNKFTGQPIQFNGTTSPTLKEWDYDTSVLTGGGLDLLVSTSGTNQISLFLQRPAVFAWSDYSPPYTNTPYCNSGPLGLACWGNPAYNFTKNVGFDFINTTVNGQGIFYQQLENPFYQSNQQNIFNFNSLAGTGTFRIHFASMDPAAQGSTDMLIVFGSGQYYIYVVNGPLSKRFIIPLNNQTESPLFTNPPEKSFTPGTDLVIYDINNDSFADLTSFGPNGNIQIAYQHGVIDGRIHLLGTDEFGGDIFSKILYALEYDLIWAIVIEGLTILIGIFIGAISGYFGGFIDMLFMRITDIFFAFPDLILAMAITASLGPSMQNVALALIIVDWSGTARLMRGQVLAERSRLYVEAARSVGNSNFRIIFRHVLPNSIYPIIVTATLGIGGVILSFSGLAFLGFGPTSGSAELGVMITDARTYVTQDPGMIFFPGMVIVLIVLAFNLLGDSLTDILDPRLRR